MIGSLKGNVAYYNSSYALVEVGGVGYKVTITKEVFGNLREVGQPLKLYTFTYVREDILDLYGFLTQDDLDLFEKLISVSGIGPKTAMGIFSVGSRKYIIDAILSANVDFFVGVPRLGRKNAQKIIIELKSKLGGTKELDLTDEEKEQSKEIVDALKSFGFTKEEAIEAIKGIKNQGKSVEDKVRSALRYLGK